MSMRFPYRHANRSTPSIPLGGRWVQPRPIITLALLGPGGTWVGEAILDTGADETLFPDSAARFLGIDLTNAPTGVVEAVGGSAFPIRYAEVVFRVADNQEHREWSGWVGFTPAKLRYPLLGLGGFLQYFTAAFHGDLEFVELTVNRLYRGT